MPGTAASVLPDTQPDTADRTSEESPRPSDSSSPPPPPTAAASSPAAGGLVLPSDVQVRERILEAEDDGEEDRVTNPGPPNKAWLEAGDLDDAPDWRSPNDLVSLSGGAGVREDRTTLPRTPAEANPLRARPRRRAPVETEAAAPAAREREPENSRPSPVSVLEAPLFSDEVFARSPAARPARNARPAAPSTRRWLGWIFAGVIVLGLAVGWSALSGGRDARPHRSRAPSAEVDRGAAEHGAETRR